jgi:hypothetical protein
MRVTFKELPTINKNQIGIQFPINGILHTKTFI